MKNKDNIKICTCAQCRGVKARKKARTRRFFKRLMSKRRRKGKRCYNFMWS